MYVKPGGEDCVFKVAVLTLGWSALGATFLAVLAAAGFVAIIRLSCVQRVCVLCERQREAEAVQLALPPTLSSALTILQIGRAHV